MIHKRCTQCGKQIENRSVTNLCAEHYGNSRLPIPDDFAERAKTMCIADLSRHYGIGSATVFRICRAAGIVAVGMREATAQKILQDYLDRQVAKIPPLKERVLPHIHAEEAARHLQKRGEVVKVSDRAGKRLNAQGPFYRVWGKVMEPAEVVAYAIEKHKFDPDAWKRLAA